MDNAVLLKKVPLFSSLKISELHNLLKKMEVRPFEKGETICEEGEPSNQNFYIIAAGQLNVFLGEKVLTTLTPTNYFGEVSLLSGEVHSATIKAATGGRLLVIKRELFEEITAGHPEVLWWLSKTLGKKLYQTTQFSHPAEHGRMVFVVISTERSAGKSVLTANLAASYCKQTGRKTAILDYCLSPHCVTLQLKLKPGQALAQLVGEGKEITHEDILDRAVRHNCGIDVLTFYDEGEQNRVDKVAIGKLFRMLKQLYELVIVDVSARPGANHLKALVEEADEIICLAKEGKSYLSFLDSLGINSINSESRLWMGAVAREGTPAKNLSHFFRFVLPYEKETVECFLVSGKPFVELFPNAELSRAIGRLAREIGGIRVGLALSAGMASGMAHIGVLKVLQRENVPIDMVAGTSGGALYSAPFVAGVPLSRVEKVVRKMNWWRMFFMLDFTFPYAGFIRGKKIADFMKQFVGNLQFEDLTIPFKVITTDFYTGEVFVIDKGRILDALRASISVPGIFVPYKYKERYLMDGATVSPIPVDVLYHSGADKVMAVNTCADPGLLHKDTSAKKPPPHFFDVITHSRAITTHHVAEIESKRADVTIYPDTSRFKWRDYHKADKIIEAGERAAEEALPRIKEILNL